MMTDDTDYPLTPGFKADGPSADAAAIIAPTANARRAQVLAFIQQAKEPLTADTIAERLNLSTLSVRPRISELKKCHLVKPDDVRGRNKSGMTAWRWRAVTP